MLAMPWKAAMQHNGTPEVWELAASATFFEISVAVLEKLARTWKAAMQQTAVFQVSVTLYENLDLKSLPGRLNKYAAFFNRTEHLQQLC